MMFRRCYFMMISLIIIVLINIVLIYYHLNIYIITQNEKFNDNMAFDFSLVNSNINENENKSRFAIMTYATPNYLDNLMLYLSSVYCTNYDILSIVYLLQWNQSEIDKLNNAIPNDYKTHSLILISVNNSELIEINETNKNEMAIIHPFKFKAIQHALCNYLNKNDILIYSDCDHIIIKNLIPLFKSIQSTIPNEIILYKRKFDFVVNSSWNKRKKESYIRKKKKKKNKKYISWWYFSIYSF
eukprot:416397_1